MQYKFGIFAILTALSATAVNAVKEAVGQPQGNPIHTPGLNHIVEAGKAYDITWTPTSEGTISFVLLRGPGDAVRPIGVIVESIANSGHYTWTPGTDLEDDVTHYGLQLIQDDTGYFQYSTQFGISNKNPTPADDSAAKKAEEDKKAADEVAKAEADKKAAEDKAADDKAAADKASADNNGSKTDSTGSGSAAPSDAATSHDEKKTPNQQSQEEEKKKVPSSHSSQEGSANQRQGSPSSSGSSDSSSSGDSKKEKEKDSSGGGLLF
ncbi:Ser-Thr-rich glycosyl-phosphatidyl-inositol-anchored membrane family-domain-containing protein [Pyronema domesticum]|nr:Ser-Thr-rich glycosyl-phosphatidyl-inositol-anchored membrane family-domain-containing protein [Pyronema domesticum]